MNSILAVTNYEPSHDNKRMEFMVPQLATTHSRLCRMSLQATLVAMTGLETMLLNSEAMVEGSTLVT